MENVENAVGMLKKRARYLLSGARLPTRWWGMATLAAAHLYRVEAGEADKAKIPFGTRVMVNVDPVPRNAFMPRSLPAGQFTRVVVCAPHDLAKWGLG